MYKKQIKYEYENSRYKIERIAVIFIGNLDVNHDKTYNLCYNN